MKTKNEDENLTQSTWRSIVHIYRAVVAYKVGIKTSQYINIEAPFLPPTPPLLVC